MYLSHLWFYCIQQITFKFYDASTNTRIFKNPVLIDNKKELVEHLNDILVEQLLQELQTIYDNTRKTISIHESNSKILKKVN